MPAVDYSLIVRDVSNILIRQTTPSTRPRHNWAYRNPGIVLVFCIVFIVATGLIALFLYRKILARKARSGN